MSQKVNDSSSTHRSALTSICDSRISDILKEESYYRIRQVIEKPIVSSSDLQEFWVKVLPYLTQRINMWNCDVLNAQKLSELVEIQQKPVFSGFRFNDNPSNPKSPTAKLSRESIKPICPVSRLDCLAIILNTADTVVAEDILRIKSKFHMTLPLIIPDIDKSGQYIVTIPYLQNIVIRWESNPGQIAENRLFTNPFSMAVALRLGNNKTGKSTILNQLMRKQYMFSSKGEPGAKYGRPLTLNGSVEMLWLTQETCSEISWKTTVCKFYEGNTDKVALLANLHGHTLEHPEVIKYLATFAHSFIVFIMPDASANELHQLRKLIPGKNVFSVNVDPPNIEWQETAIQTDTLTNDDTMKIVRELLCEALNDCTRHCSDSLGRGLTLTNDNLRFAKSFYCKESEKIIKIVNEKGCLKVKELLCNLNVEKHRTWKFTSKELVLAVVSIFSLPCSQAKQSLVYLETQLSQISTNELLNIRQDPSDSPDQMDKQELEKAGKNSPIALNKIGNRNLGQEHLFRMLGLVYAESVTITNLADLQGVKDLPSKLAELLIGGHAIEILNGDIGEIQNIWIKAIYDGVSKKLPRLRIFVLSIIGKQSSGKSTLLNALFSCKFAVSVGRCTRGLFMRMIFLDEDLRKSHGYDCIILIDTEGLCSSETMNDPKAKKKDRLMTTFAMGISNLTLVNILGEGLAEMAEILQIAIVAMDRLKSGKIKPDILVVQHLQERNLERVAQAKEQFREAINKAFELIDKNDVGIGSTAEECLTELIACIKSGNLFKHFGAFKDGSSVNSPPSETFHDDIVDLYQKVLQRAKGCGTKLSFQLWSELFESFWGCVRNETFALNFTNVKHITEHLYYAKKVAKVKELNGRAIRHHRDSLSQSLMSKLTSKMKDNNDSFSPDDTHDTLLDSMKEKLDLIPHRCNGCEAEENSLQMTKQCDACKEFQAENDNLLKEIEGTEWNVNFKHSLAVFNESLHVEAMKMLKQTIIGSVVKLGCYSRFNDLIKKELQGALDKRPNGKYSEKEQEDIVERIWKLLEKDARPKETGSELHIRMKSALKREYEQTGLFSDILNIYDQKSEKGTVPLIRAKVAKVKPEFYRAYCDQNDIDKEQMQNLINALNDVVKDVLKSRGSDYKRTGLDFDDGMVAEIKEKFPDAVKAFESENRLSLQGSFKTDLQISTLHRLENKMEKPQKIWDSQNKPSEILESKKDEYKTQIKTRLRNEFSYAGDGEIMANLICEAIKKKANESVLAVQIQAVKTASWTANSEKVRLRYFAKLAEEVASGRKVRALIHFEDPKMTMKKWFKDEIDLLVSGGKFLETYKSTLIAELNQAIKGISDSSNKKILDDFLNRYLKDVDDQCYIKPEIEDCDFEVFRNSIVRHLENILKSDLTVNITLHAVHDNPEVSGRLGCTDRCSGCRAICWGSVDHKEDTSNVISAHYSCHQPRGLSGSSHLLSNKLCKKSCYQRRSEVYSMSGQRVKWKKDPHYVAEFEELMRWFFQELHKDIAKQKALRPIDDGELEKSGYINLDLKRILKVVNSKI